MTFKEFNKKYKVPSEILLFINNKRIRSINKAHRSGDYIYDINNEYILKISKNKERLLKEKEVNDLFYNKLPVSKSILYIEDKEYSFYIKSKIKGTPLYKYINKPNLVIKLLKEAFDILHKVDVSDINIINYESEGNKLVHGDFCLPNILVYKNRISGFIDTEAMGLGDQNLDYYWCIWSFEYNLGSKDYTKELIKELNIKFNNEIYKKYIGKDY